MNADERLRFIAYRLERARETLQEARVLLAAGQLRGTINRVYYAMFYSVNALALSHGFATASHGQLRGWFNREFVRTGRVPIEFGNAYGAAFDSRTKGDYDDLVEFDRAQVESLVSEADRFIGCLDALTTGTRLP